MFVGVVSLTRCGNVQGVVGCLFHWIQGGGDKGRGLEDQHGQDKTALTEWQEQVTEVPVGVGWEQPLPFPSFVSFPRLVGIFCLKVGYTKGGEGMCVCVVE